MAKKPGPKTEVHSDMERATYTVDRLTRRRLAVLGQANESMGVRVAARVAFDRYQRSLEASALKPFPAMSRADLIQWLIDLSHDNANHPAGQAATMLKEIS